ncbi:MAG TPA: GIY-YIG nuclease family protein [Candidatus Paceibacterota bacterium]
MKEFGVYILRSLKNNTYYIGSTEDISKRLVQHNAGAQSYTRKLIPFVLERFILCKSFEEARHSEYKLKKYKRKDIVNKVIADGVFPWNY